MAEGVDATVYKNPSCMDAHLLSYHCDFHPRYSYISLPILHVYSDTYLPFRNLIWILEHYAYRSSVLYMIGYYIRCDMSRHCSAHVPSPTPPTAAVLPRSLPASQPTPVLSASSPTAAVAISDSASRDQLLRDIDVRSTGTDTLPSLLTYFHHFSHRLPRRSNTHLGRRTCHLLLGHAREVEYRIPRGIPAVVIY